MKKAIMTFAAVLCCWVTTVHAQTAEPESNWRKYLRLIKETEENPNDWKIQYEMASLLCDKKSGVYDFQKSAKYFERIYHVATDYNREIPDSVLGQAISVLAASGVNKRDANYSLFYIDEYMHAKKVGIAVNDSDIIGLNLMGVVLNIIQKEPVRALSCIMEMRRCATENNLPGLEYSDVYTAIMFDNVMGMYKRMYGDKLLEITLEGKKYIIIAMNEWNVESPLMGWHGELEIADSDNNNKEDKRPTVLYGEDGRVYDDVHGDMLCSVKYDRNGIEPQENYNMRMITVTPEKRQQLVSAYQSYMKKNKKAKKKN